MNSLILAAIVFCSGFKNMTQRQNCTYDALACFAKEEREWEFVKENPKLNFYLQIENSQRLQGAANCLLIHVNIKEIKK